MPILTYTKKFGNAISSVLPIVCGVPESVFSGVSDRYRVEISAEGQSQVTALGNGQSKFRINAYLQDKLSFTAGTQWEGITQDIPGFGMALKKLDSAAQGLLGRTAQTTISTQRKWSGSSPIGINLKLKFEAVSKVDQEVITPCQILQSLTLPRGGVGNIAGLIPPGPNPYTFKQEGAFIRGENVTINIGNFIRFNSVIITSVKVTYENRMSVDGPIGAEVDLGIETWRMLTREELQKAYNSGISITTSGDLQGVVTETGPRRQDGTF